MKIYSWNVNGIRAVLKKGRFYPFLEAHQPDILCLQETKAERGQIEIDLPDYREYWNSAVKKGYSGTAIFSKREPVAVTSGFPDEIARRFKFADELQRDSADEGRVMTAEFDRCFVVTVYTPNSTALPAVGSGFSCLLQAAGGQEAGSLLRRSERRPHRARSRQPEAESRQEGIHRRGAGGFSELCRRGFRRYAATLQAG